MPYLKVQTNVAVSEAAQSALLFEASRLVSADLGKKEEFFMGAIEPETSMIFAGSDEPLAFVELRSIGLPGEKTKTLSAHLARVVETELKIPKKRIYIKFIDVQRGMWGWNGDTF